jgi:ribosomal protein L14
MGVVVASTITKSGSVFAGDVVRIVVVRTDPGYRPNPGSPGTGTIVATYCG